MVSMIAGKVLHGADHSDGDPKAKVIEAVGDVSDIQITGVQLLVGTYLRPDKLKSGIILTDKFRDEDVYQGKVGLVLKLAPGAFVDGHDAQFYGVKPKVGDWVFYRVSDGFSMNINGHHCRMLEDVHVKGIIPNPDVVL